MARTANDLYLSPEGDLVIRSGDLRAVTENEYLLQSARSRIKSIKSDWFYDHIGADLESILGEPNTREISDLGKAKIITALTEDDMFTLDDVYIKDAPTGRNSVLYIVALKTTSGSPMILNVTMDLVRGISIL